MSGNSKENLGYSIDLKATVKKVFKKISGISKLSPAEVEERISNFQNNWIEGTSRKEPLGRKEAISNLINNGDAIVASGIVNGLRDFNQFGETQLLLGMILWTDNEERNNGNSGTLAIRKITIQAGENNIKELQKCRSELVSYIPKSKAA